MSTQCPHGQLARQCLLCEQAAEIERLRLVNKRRHWPMLVTANAGVKRLPADED